jgi:hypothetical protein
LTFLAMLSAAPAFSQDVEVTALAGYTTPGGSSRTPGRSTT